MALNYKKGAASGPITIDFPSNDNENHNWIKLSRPTGKSLSRLDQLQSLVRFDPNAPGKPLPALDYMQVIARVMVECSIAWSLADVDSGEPIPINEETLLELDAEDYTYLVNEFSGYLVSTKKAASGKEGDPKPTITVTEKNESLSSSTPDSTVSKTSDSPRTNSQPEKPLITGSTRESTGPVTAGIG